MRTRRGAINKAASAWSLVIFSVGGRRLAARLEDVGGIWPWREPTLVPSRTPHVGAVMRQGDEFLAVYNLAGALGLHLQGGAPLGLVLKTDRGPMAVCIDGTVPTMHQLDPGEIEPAPEGAGAQIGSCRIAGEEVSIFSFRSFGDAPAMAGEDRP